MEPIPETADVLRDLTEHGQEGLVLTLMGMARRAEAIVPECVGMSVELVEEGLTFTLVGSEKEPSGGRSDAHPAQHPDQGGRVEVGERGEAGEAATDDLLDEESWLSGAQEGAASGIASTLSLPIMDHGQVIGDVSLYASTPHAFEGRQLPLADALGAWAGGAVRNADLSFDTRQLAVASVPHFEDSGDIEIAVGILMTRHGVDDAAARAHLYDAAARASITVAQAARAIKHMNNQE